MRHRPICLLVLLLAGVAQSQTVYRCGNQFSQTPCAADAQARPNAGVAPAVAASGPRGFALCTAEAMRRLQPPEPASTRVLQLGERRTEVIRYADRSLAAPRYELSADVKTAYGLYGGPLRFACWLSEDQARVLRFEALP